MRSIFHTLRLRWWIAVRKLVWCLKTTTPCFLARPTRFPKTQAKVRFGGGGGFGGAAIETRERGARLAHKFGATRQRLVSRYATLAPTRRVRQAREARRETGRTNEYRTSFQCEEEGFAGVGVGRSTTRERQQLMCVGFAFECELICAVTPNQFRRIRQFGYGCVECAQVRARGECTVCTHEFHKDKDKKIGIK